MLVFELTIPNRGSWNGQWSQQNERHIIVRRENDVHDKEKLQNILETGDYWYHWSDGWSACVTVTKMDARSTNKLKKISAGFCGYDWMVDSIIQFGEILNEKERQQRREALMNQRLL